MGLTLDTSPWNFFPMCYNGSVEQSSRIWGELVKGAIGTKSDQQNLKRESEVIPLG